MDSYTPKETHDATVNVLAIAGMGRSGSTLLSSLLGLVPGVVPVGELSAVWQAAELDELCSCGASFSQCPFWTAVGESAFGGWGHVDLEHLAAVNRQLIVSHRKIPFLLSPRLRGRERRLIESYTTELDGVYRAIKQVTGATVLVDSTKGGPYVLVIRKMLNIQVQMIHLVRDSRGVASSWRKLVERPEYAGVPGHEGTKMGGVAPARSGPEWLIRNLLVHFIGALGTPRLLVRYESLIANPLPEIRRVLEFSGRDAPLTIVSGVSESEYEAREFHTVGGNRIRFQRGRIPLRLDEAWKTEMRPSDRRLVAATTFPLLVKYGYVDPCGRKT